MDTPPGLNETSTRINLNCFYFKVKSRCGRGGIYNRNSMMKLTKLPEYDFDSKVVWPQKNSYVLHPRLRRIVSPTDDDTLLTTSRSLKGELEPLPKPIPSSCSRKKIVTVAEDNDKHKDPIVVRKKVQTRRTDTKSFSTKYQKESDVNLTPSNKPSGFIAPFIYYDKSDLKQSAKPIALNNNRKNDNKNMKSNKTTCQVSKVNIPNRGPKIPPLGSKTRISKEKEKSQDEGTNLPNKTLSMIRKNTTHSNLSLQETDITRKRSGPFSYNSKNRHLPVIKVPIEKCVRPMIDPPITSNICSVDCTTEVEKKNINNCKDMGVGNDKKPEVADVITEPDYKLVKNQGIVQTDKFFISNYDRLYIRNVTSKDKNYEAKEDKVKLCGNSLPNLQTPALEITPQKNSDKLSSKNITESNSYTIGRTTIEYTGKQKIDFHVVSNKEEAVSSPLNNSMNFASIPKEEISKIKDADKILEEKVTKNNKVNNKEQVKHENEQKSINCSHVCKNNKLVKPSGQISTIRPNNIMLHNDNIFEQFQKELNLTDSSLQLEGCSMAADKPFTDTNVEFWVSKSELDIKDPEYNSFLSKFESDTNIDDAETMAYKSLFLLNLLIHDEQRRARNLLFILKMREDALKDFTKSQILWLENKKRNVNVDIPTLENKQRDFVLKYQHECRELQRKRKALLAVSEKRKVVLLKNKENLEFKMKNSVIVQQILLGKKALNRSSICENPLKCFDLPSSGCEDGITSRPKSEKTIFAFNSAPVDLTIKGAEKSIQTGKSLLNLILVEQSTEIATDNFVNVDGSYLNLLFYNLPLPEIFSSGKKYEINEGALRSIVYSANDRKHLYGGEFVERFIDEIKVRNPDRSTTPSIARNLVEELDQSAIDTPERNQIDKCSKLLSLSKETMFRGFVEVATQSTYGDGDDVPRVFDNTATQVSPDAHNAPSDVVSISKMIQAGGKEEVTTVATQADSLPEPAGTASIITDASSGLDTPPFVQAKSSWPSSSSLNSMSSPLSSLVLPVHSEAEELRRQQLGIEQEIKALEQQRNLLFVKGISLSSTPKPSCIFAADDSVIEEDERILSDSSSIELTDPDNPTIARSLEISASRSGQLALAETTVDKRKSDEENLGITSTTAVPSAQHVD